MDCQDCLGSDLNQYLCWQLLVAMVRSSDVLSLLLDKPFAFWPLQAGLSKQERAVRLARLGIYVGVAYSVRDKDPQHALLAAVAAYGLISAVQSKTTVDLSSAGLAKTPNPVGNAPVGDVGGRNTVAPVGSNLTPDILLNTMQQPQNGYLDRAITAVASPFDAESVGGQEPDLGSNLNTKFDSRGNQGLTNVASSRGLTVPPR